MYISLYTIAFGEGCIRACLPSVGADQFDSKDPPEARQQSSFFNWFTFCLSVGSFAGLVLIVWLESNKGWDVGFGVSAFLTLLGLLVAAAGLPFYRNRVPQGSAITRVLQVLVVAFKNRRLELPENMQEAQEPIDGECSHEVSSLVQENSLKYPDKECINTGKDGGWSVCSVAKQGATTNTRLGRIHVSPRMLFIIPTTFQMFMLVAYDRFLVPILRRHTGHVAGITHLQRVGIGFLAMVVAPVIAAVVEAKRRESSHMIFLFWLPPEFFLLGVADTKSFVGLLEFFQQ
ncbi:hypothetical protein C2845_PM14G06220 [Panicum miliaceum]|uniref:Uncharacterized protein n=1 Tax=Panicum miliaceum TaxID=4540 RepID=A0A3L6PRN1_PANMI|nr:hypothetical protein C2845_PM14G06220 [Panicum miliaceum]